MTDRPHRQSLLVAGALLAPVLYVLSIGPVARLLYTVMPQREQAKQVLQVIYAPIGWVVHHGPSGVGDWIEAYARFWVKR
jgi:hypothetical protein